MSERKNSTMKEVGLTEGPKRLRLLVAIASYGTRNFEHLKTVVSRYQRMALDVDIVVFSDGPKSLGPEVEVIVGVPDGEPWALPFAHKRFFAERKDEYDLYAYSEDDMDVREENVRAFVRAAEVLKEEEIAGFLRYEFNQALERSFPDMHGKYHWEPSSVRRRNQYTIAQFTNEHAAFYLLTRAQLGRAIASGGFLRGPCAGRYDMLCTAATDPYANCGMRKVICISDVDAFLIHHLPNRYAGEVGADGESFAAQIGALMEIGEKVRPACSLFDSQSVKSANREVGDYYQNGEEEFLSLIPQRARSVLSIGCGVGGLEGALKQRGLWVTGLPLDSVIGAVAVGRGIEVLDGTLEAGLRELSGRHFDVVLLRDTLQYCASPFSILVKCSRLMAPGGSFLMSGVNGEYFPVWIGAWIQLVRRGSSSVLHAKGAGSEAEKGWTVGAAARLLRRGGIDLERVVWKDRIDSSPVSGAVTSLKGWRAWLRLGWRWMRRIGLQEKLRQSQGPRSWMFRPGRMLAQRWIIRAMAVGTTVGGRARE